MNNAKDVDFFNFGRIYRTLYREMERTSEYFLKELSLQLGNNESLEADIIKEITKVLKEKVDEGLPLEVRRNNHFMLGSGTFKK
ncbi:MAG: hypothetical protein HZB79_06225 [Deltaproteobacteria bacterium]|nr:hypothetical protein [Deltaproteobacteria bacterium]